MKEILNKGDNMKQISVFLENKEGKLRSILKILGDANINLLALSIADTSKYGILRLIVSDNNLAIEKLNEANFTVREDEVAILEIPDKPNGLNSILEILEEVNINLEYIYAFSTNKLDEATTVMKFEDLDNAISLLEEKGAKILKEEDLKDI